MPPATLEHQAAIAEGFATSADDTRIAYRRLGTGPALLFVHGSISTHTDWMRVAKLLAPRYTCYAMDRRGRAHSGSGRSPYSLEREYEDIAAVLNEAETAQAAPLAALIGHSFGAICALGAALCHPVPRLVVYEPPLPAGGPIAGEFLEPYKRAIAEGDPDTALEIGLSHFTRLPADAIAAMRASKAWPRLRTLAPSWIRELEAMDALDPSMDRYTALACPVLMLVGSLSPEHPLRDASRALAKALPSAGVETIEGQGHVAMRNAPEQVARLIESFLAS
ncbi:MAG TPA: alpha/beta hydrolase [Terracidiphilus sp.]|nr:alpha/beta hydrolase [Terracidiphilus sp.]